MESALIEDVEKRRCLFDNAEPNYCNRTYVSSESKKEAKKKVDAMVRTLFILFIFCVCLPVCLCVCLSACLSIGVHRRSCAHCVCYGTDATRNFAATENEAPNLRALCLGL